MICHDCGLEAPRSQMTMTSYHGHGCSHEVPVCRDTVACNDRRGFNYNLDVKMWPRSAYYARNVAPLQAQREREQRRFELENQLQANARGTIGIGRG